MGSFEKPWMNYRYKVFKCLISLAFWGNSVIEPSVSLSGEKPPKLWILASWGRCRFASRFLIFKWTQKIVLSSVLVVVHGWAQGILIGWPWILCCAVQTSLCQMLSSHKKLL